MGLIKKFSMAFIAILLFCSINNIAVSAESIYEEITKLPELESYYSNTNPYYDALVTLCKGKPYFTDNKFIGDDIATGDVLFNEGLNNVVFEDLDNDGINEMIINYSYFGKPCFYIFTNVNGKIFAIADVWDCKYCGISERNGKKYIIFGNYEYSERNWEHLGLMNLLLVKRMEIL